MDESLLGDLIFHYHKGDLDEQDAAEVVTMIQTNPEAKAIYPRILDAEKYASSENGKAWLESLPDRVLASVVKKQQAPAFPSFVEQFKAWFTPRKIVLSCSTDAVPIYGKAGPNDEIMFTMRPTSTGQMEISLSTKIEVWSSLIVFLGEHHLEIRLKQVGDRWADSLEFPLSFAALGTQRPNISVQNA